MTKRYFAFADVAFVHLKRFSDGPKRIHFPGYKPLLPDICTRDGLDQRPIAPHRAFADRIGSYDEPNLLAAPPPQPCLNAEAKQILSVPLVRPHGL